MINSLEGEIGTLPRSGRKELQRGLNEAKDSIKRRKFLLGRYADDPGGCDQVGRCGQCC